MNISEANFQSRKISFTHGSNEFYSEVKARVNNYFKSKNISTHFDYRMVIKTIAILSVYIGSYLLILSGWLNVWQMWGMCVLVGVCTAGLGFSVAHDAIHGAYSANPKVNEAIGFTMNLIGGNKYVWSITHNIIHHTYTNIHGVDEDLEVFPAAIRMSKNMKRNPIHRVQHITAFFLYGFAVIFWVLLKDFKKIFQKNIGPYKVKQHPRRELILLFATKALYYTYIFVIPIVLLPLAWWQFLIGYITVYLIAGLILGVVFQLAHVVEDLDTPDIAEDGVIDNNWAVHQMHTTANFAMKNRIINWYVGGLNFQVEHHLFPKVCHIHYPAISKIVEQTAHDFNVPYNYHRTFIGAVRSHYRTLKQLGRE